MEKVIYNINTSKLVVLNEYNKIIPDVILDKYIIDNIDFSKFPSNIFDNVCLYLGNDYICYNINLQWIKDFLINENIIFDEEYKCYINKNDNNYFKIQSWLYEYDQIKSELWISYRYVEKVIERKFNFNNRYIMIELLTGNIIINYYGWNTNLISSGTWNLNPIVK